MITLPSSIFYDPLQQMMPSPVFTINPLKLMSANKLSESLNYSNLNNLNLLYYKMKSSFTSANTDHISSISEVIFNVNNSNKPFLLSKQKIFKGQKIFNISKEFNPFNRRKSVKIIYKNDEDNQSNNHDILNEDSIENYEIKNEISEEQLDNGESGEKQADQIFDDETFDWIHNNFLNK